MIHGTAHVIMVWDVVHHIVVDIVVDCMVHMVHAIRIIDHAVIVHTVQRVLKNYHTIVICA